ncbi:MAG TPA: hypothetical protein PKC72_04900 [Chitinophagaceae bacterium]|nr:hypothetical protein [Chitinophagaceae bacterium]
MRTVYLRILIFILIVVVGDITGGVVCRYLYNITNDPPTVKLKHTLNSTNEDILILGNSRAECHFVSDIIKDSTGLTIYNCGIGGADFLFSEIQLKESLKRYRPKLVVLEASPNSFFLVNGEDKLKALLPFYKRDTLIYNALTKGNFFEKVKFISSIYPYNSTIGASLRGVFKKSTDTLMGFVPAFGTIDSVHEINYMNHHYKDRQINESDLNILRRIINSCIENKIKLMIISTPVYFMSSNYCDLETKIKQYCSAYSGNVHFFDYTDFKKTKGRKDLFYDNFHLNEQGARVFTQQVSGDIINIIQD